MQNSLLRTDKELVACYTRNVGTVYRVCYTLLQNAPDAEDAVQTVFIKLLESGKVFESTDHEKAWLITTARNYCTDQLRCWWRRKRSDVETLPEIPVWDTGESSELYDRLMALPPKYKLALYLFYYEGYPTAQIAAILGEKDATIRTRLRTGRKKLKLELEGECSG